VNVKDAITAIYHENKGRYGYRRITAQLRQCGFSLNHKTVQRLMKVSWHHLPGTDEEIPFLQGRSGQNCYRIC
jgi:transposase InsO family protein